MKSQVKEKDTARDQARLKLESITEMVAALDVKDDSKHDDAVETITNDALSIQVRSEWHNVGQMDVVGGEYQILLCWGGPAVRMIGDLSEHQEPETARLEYQDWGTPWTEYPVSGEEEEILLTYARCFAFGS